MLKSAETPDRLRVRDILAKARELKGLDSAEVASLMEVQEPALLEEMFSTARAVKDEIYGNRLVLFAPLYISNLCKNECSYCAFRTRNRAVKRRALSLEEIRSLLKGQWRDGMVPHIVYHTGPSDYFPTPEFWQIEGSPSAPALATSGITQPPLLASVLHTIHTRTPVTSFVKEVYPALLRWHRWFHTQRDADGTRLACLVHPWESGTDDSPRWLDAMSRFVPHDLPVYRRRDTVHVAGSQRPNQVAPAALDRSERTTQRYFNTDAFVAAPQFTLGNAPRFPLHAPGINNWDLSIMRNFKFKEHYTIRRKPNLGTDPQVYYIV